MDEKGPKPLNYATPAPRRGQALSASLAHLTASYAAMTATIAATAYSNPQPLAPSTVFKITGAVAVAPLHIPLSLLWLPNSDVGSIVYAALLGVGWLWFRRQGGGHP